MGPPAFQHARRMAGDSLDAAAWCSKWGIWGGSAVAKRDWALFRVVNKYPTQQLWNTSQVVNRSFSQQYEWKKIDNGLAQ